MGFEPEDEFEDDDNYTLLFAQDADARPLSWYTAAHFGLTLVMGFHRTFLEAVSNLDDALYGSEGYAQSKKEFEDEARMAIESISDGDTSDSA